jgi:clan AA aspartic protease
MGKVIEKVKLTSLFNSAKSFEVDAVVDPGATMLVLPQNLVDELNLRKIPEATVKYADNHRRQKSVYAGVLVEIKGRVGSFDVLAEEEGTEPLIGQMVLEELDLVVEPRTRTLMPNPRSPEMPMVEIL